MSEVKVREVSANDAENIAYLASQMGDRVFVKDVIEERINNFLKTKNEQIFIAEKDGKVVGYAVEDRVKGKWGPIDYMLGFDPDGKIKDVIVMELKERRGRPVKERRFLDQFKGKSIQEPIKLNKDIKGVAGATISSRGMSNGIRKLVYIFNELYKK